MFYHISNIRAINKIGPHNEAVLSVIIFQHWAMVNYIKEPVKVLEFVIDRVIYTKSI